MGCFQTPGLGKVGPIAAEATQFSSLNFPATRHKVLARAYHKYQQPGCNHPRFLEVHHIVPQSKGGTNDPTNLACLCSAFNQLLHDQKSGGMGILVKERSAVFQCNL